MPIAQNASASPFDRLLPVYIVTRDYIETCEALAYVKAELCDDAHVIAQLEELDKLYRFAASEAEIAAGEASVAKAWGAWQAAQG
jgi:hypothetical protein